MLLIPRPPPVAQQFPVIAATQSPDSTLNIPVVEGTAATSTTTTTTTTVVSFVESESKGGPPCIALDPAELAVPRQRGPTRRRSSQAQLVTPSSKRSEEGFSVVKIKYINGEDLPIQQGVQLSATQILRDALTLVEKRTNINNLRREASTVISSKDFRDMFIDAFWWCFLSDVDILPAQELIAHLVDGSLASYEPQPMSPSSLFPSLLQGGMTEKSVPQHLSRVPFRRRWIHNMSSDETGGVTSPLSSSRGNKDLFSLTCINSELDTTLLSTLKCPNTPWAKTLVEEKLRIQHNEVQMHKLFNQMSYSYVRILNRLTKRQRSVVLPLFSDVLSEGLFSAIATAVPYAQVHLENADYHKILIKRLTYWLGGVERAQPHPPKKSVRRSGIPSGRRISSSVTGSNRKFQKSESEVPCDTATPDNSMLTLEPQVSSFTATSHPPGGVSLQSTPRIQHITPNPQRRRGKKSPSWLPPDSNNLFPSDISEPASVSLLPTMRLSKKQSIKPADSISSMEEKEHTISIDTSTRSVVKVIGCLSVDATQDMVKSLRACKQELELIQSGNNKLNCGSTDISLRDTAVTAKDTILEAWKQKQSNQPWYETGSRSREQSRSRRSGATGGFFSTMDSSPLVQRYLSNTGIPLLSSKPSDMKWALD